MGHKKFEKLYVRSNWIQKVRADEIGRQIQAYALYCGISPTGSNSTKGANSQNS